MKIGVIVNANSRRNRRRPHEVDQLRALLTPADLLRETRALEDVPAALDELREHGVDVLALSGGDGTNHHTLTALLRAHADWHPAVALLRGGTMNTVSNSFGLRGRPVSILRALTRAAARNETVAAIERNLLCVHADDGPRWGFIFGNGVVHDWLEVYYDDPDPSPVVAARVFARAVASTIVQGPFARRLNRTLHCEATADGAPWTQGEFISFLASTQEQIGLGLAPWHRCRERPGHFHAIAIRPPIARIARALPGLLARGRFDSEGIDHRVTRELVLLGDTPKAWILDGDAYRSHGPLRVEIGPTLRILQPRPA